MVAADRRDAHAQGARSRAARVGCGVAQPHGGGRGAPGSRGRGGGLVPRPEGRAPRRDPCPRAQAGERLVGRPLVCTLEPCDHQASTPPCTQRPDRGGDRSCGGRDARSQPDGRRSRDRAACGAPVSRSRPGCSSTRRSRSTWRSNVTSRPGARSSCSRWHRASTARRRPVTVPRGGSPARPPVPMCTGFARGPTRSSWERRTAIADDPHLTVRGPDTASARPPLRVVVDSSGRVPPTLHLFDDAAATLVATTDRAPGARIDEWTATGARGGASSIATPTAVSACRRSSRSSASATCRVCCSRVGPPSPGARCSEGLVDRIVVYLAPLLVGGSTRPDRARGRGVRARSARRCDSGRSRWRPIDDGPEGGGRCSPGSLRSSARCAASTAGRLVVSRATS